MILSSTDYQNQAEPADEMLDLVDQQDQVIGVVARGVANRDHQLTHREIGVIIVDDEKRVLLQKRSQYKTVNPSMWSITAGHVPAGEDPDEVAHIELSEELGFDIQLTFIVKRLNTYPWESHFMYYYVGVYHDEKITMAPAEVEKIGFFSQPEMNALIESGEKVNPTHVPLFEEIWAGGYDKEIYARE